MAGIALLTAAVLATAATSVVNEDAKLTASDGAADDYFGLSVAVSGDTVVVGADSDDDTGSAYVFTPDGLGGYDETKLTASDAAARDYFGESVAVSGDTVVVGASYNDDGGDNSGSAYVFTPDGLGGYDETKLTASDAAEFDYFGRAVAVSGDTVVVGASGDDDGGDFSGSAYVFTRSGGVWTEQAKLVASDAAAEDYFGGSVAVSGDTVVVGASGDDDDDGGDGSGSAYVFTPDGLGGYDETKLTASDAAELDRFGDSVAVSGDTVVVGAPYDDDDDGGDDSGSAYVFDMRRPANGFLAPTSIQAKPGKKLAVSATLDLGDATLDLAGGATIDYGALRTEVPAFTPNAKGTRWTYTSEDKAFRATITTPRDLATSRATLRLRVKGWDETLPSSDAGGDLLALCFASGDFDVGADAVLVRGRHRAGKEHLESPPVTLGSVRATMKPGKPVKVKIVASFAGDGTVPGAAPVVSLSLGAPDATYDTEVSAATHDVAPFAGGFRYTLASGAPRAGITSLVLDHVRRRVTIRAEGADFGDYAADGTAPFVFGLGLGAPADAVQVSAQKKGSKLRY